MKKHLVLLALAVLVAVPALAQTKDVSQIGVRMGDPNFGPAVTGDFCTDPNAPIPDGNPTGLNSNLVVPAGGVISDFALGLEITHTWVGDIRATITHVDTATSVVAMDRPGFPASAFGCSREDIDVTLADSGTSPVETACAVAVPTISGVLTPNNPLSAFNGQNLTGTWTLNVSDNAGQDTGTLNTWCVSAGAGGTTGGTTTGGTTTGGTTTGGTPTPTTNTWGVVALIALFLAVSMFYLRRRGASHA